MGELDTATAELVYQLVGGLISIVVTVIGGFATHWLNTSAFAKKYELDRVITENTIHNAVVFAEKIGKKNAWDGIKKKEYANKYLDKIDPKLVKKYSGKLGFMIDRKVAQIQFGES